MAARYALLVLSILPKPHRMCDTRHALGMVCDSKR